MRILFYFRDKIRDTCDKVRSNHYTGRRIAASADLLLGLIRIKQINSV